MAAQWSRTEKSVSITPPSFYLLSSHAAQTPGGSLPYPLQHTPQHLESSFECGAHEFVLAHFIQSQPAFALSCFTEPGAAAVVTMCTTITTTRI